jgi:hypothetical protein
MLTDERNGLALLMISGMVALAYQTVAVGW